MFGGGVIRTGAPRAIWSALAPTILAFSNLVNLGGPISDDVSMFKSTSQ